MEDELLKRILIIDDDSITRKLLVEFLSNHGYEVIASINGKKGVELYRKNPFDLVITDIIMPEMDGLETIQELKIISPTLKIIAISGGGNLVPGHYLGTAKKIGADMIFTKPLDLDEILDGMKQLLGENN